MARCRQCGQANPDEARFCLACGTRLDEESPSDGRRRVTVMFADLVESTALAERLDAEPLQLLLDRYFATASDIVLRHGGSLEKFIGDAVVAVFGFPRAHEDDAVRAVRAAGELRDAVAVLEADAASQFGVELAVHIGVNTGDVVVGSTADGGVRATGDAVNLAARLQQTARPGEILLGESTYRLVRNVVRARPLAPLSLKGKSGHVTAARLIELNTTEAVHPIVSPLVGREAELHRLEAEFSDVGRTETCRLIAVVGPPGVGKSRLVREFTAAHASDALVLRGRCLPYGDGITFWPIREAVAGVAGIRTDDSAAVANDKLRALLPAGPEGDAVVANVAELLGLSHVSSPVEARSWGIRRLFEVLAQGRRLILVLDDVQWAERTFIELVEHLRHAQPGSLLIVLLARPEFFDVYPEITDVGSLVELASLSRDDAKALVANLVAGAPAELGNRVAEVSDGNPLFVEELVRVLVDDGALRATDDGWQLVRELENLRAPPTIHALLAARLDLLGSAERAILGCAAVEGRIFHRGAVVDSGTADARTADVALAALVERQLIRSEPPAFDGDRAFRFHHLLLRDVAYESLRKTERARLHEAFASWLEQKVSGRAAEYDEILGYHFELAHDLRVELAEPTADLGERAAARLAGAGLRAYARGDMPAAASLLARATTLLPTASSLRDSLLPQLREARIESGALAPSRGEVLRCFWSWPPGHSWLAVDRRGRQVLRCRRCGNERTFRGVMSGAHESADSQARFAAMSDTTGAGGE